MGKEEESDVKAELDTVAINGGGDVLTLPDGKQIDFGKISDDLNLPELLLDQISQLRSRLAIPDPILNSVVCHAVLVGGSSRFPHFKELFMQMLHVQAREVFVPDASLTRHTAWLGGAVLAMSGQPLKWIS